LKMAAEEVIEPIKLDPLERDVLLAHLEPFVAASADPAARKSLLTLKEAVADLEIPPELASRLGAIAEVLLTSGRVRGANGPGAEQALWRLFQKTPQGRAAMASLEMLNMALKSCEGQSIEFLSAVARGPGSYALVLKTAECQMTVRFEPSGVRVENVEIG